MSLKHKVPRVSSAIKAVELGQVPPPMIIGERLNTQGSKKAKSMVLNNDFDGLVSLARDQANDGAHCIDVCVATTERSDEKEFMKNLVKRLSLEVEAPLVIDSTDPKVIEEAVIQIPGKPIINSINLEGDGSRFHSLAPLMSKYGIPAITMCIGPAGMAKTASEKIEVAKLLYETGKKYNLEPWQFLFDVLTFTLATGEPEYANSAKETLSAISLIKKELKGSFTTLGLSNVSFGLPSSARKVVNSVFLHHAIRAGLDTVIINAKDIIPVAEIAPEQVKLAEDLIFNKHDNALSDLISYFTENKGLTVSTSKKVDLDPSWDYDKKCYFRIVNRINEGIEADVKGSITKRVLQKLPNDRIHGENNVTTALKDNPTLSHEAAVGTLNEVLLPAMKEVGDKFGAGELILPFVLKSAECMKLAVAELEKYLIKKQGISKGKLVLCTVYGDVHDIGKNLVKTILSNNGYSVFDLGKQVPIARIVEKIKEVSADAVGLSALLVSTSKQMQIFVETARQMNLNIPVLCGGAAINSDYINRIAKNQDIYNPGVFYCKTAFDGLRVMNKLMSTEKEEYLTQWIHKLSSWKDKPSGTVTDTDIVQSSIVPVSAPVPPSIDIQVRLEPKDIDLYEIWKYLNKKSLFVLSWGIRGAAAKDLGPETEKLYLEWKDKVVNEGLFYPRIVYAYFKCHGLNTKLTVESKNGDVVFDFPRSSKGKRLSITDYFGKEDIVAFQAVTVGNEVSKKIDELNSQNKYTDAYYLHGLAVETAEALAEWTHRRIRKELGINNNRGLRYSWGYPSCPDVLQHHLVWKLIDGSKSGMRLTEAGQIIPEQSTAAIVVHHPEAEYFLL
jgi:5-methyltetrahydrofolate--homocysteine methyltransferase